MARKVRKEKDFSVWRQGEPNIKASMDFKAFDAQRDEDIDYSEVEDFAPDIERWLAKQKPRKRVMVSMRLDMEVRDWLRKALGRGYQTFINDLLLAFMAAKRRSHGANLARPQGQRT